MSTLSSLDCPFDRTEFTSLFVFRHPPSYDGNVRQSPAVMVSMVEPNSKRQAQPRRCVPDTNRPPCVGTAKWRLPGFIKTQPAELSSMPRSHSDDWFADIEK